VTWYFLRPATPLLFKDGRTFDAVRHGESMAWPMPQQLLGAARSAVGRALGFDWDFARATAANASAEDRAIVDLVGTPAAPGAIRIAGPFLARRAEDGRIDLALTRPADVLAFPTAPLSGDGERPPRLEHTLRPWVVGPGRGRGGGVSPAPPLARPLAPLAHLDPEPLDHSRPSDLPKPLPARLAGRFVEPGLLERLLLTPRPARLDGPSRSADVRDPVLELRTRLAVAGDTQTAEEGLLFSTTSLAMPAEAGDAHGNLPEREYGLMLRIDGDGGDGLDLSAPWRLGGKGGVAEAGRVELGGPPLGAVRDRVADAVRRAEDGRIRWVLATPARFRNGWLPDFLDPTSGEGTLPGTACEVRLVAAAVPRAVTYSGWALQAAGSRSGRGRARGAPRPSRRFVPAGAVYFFESDDATAAAEAVEQCWLESLHEPPGAAGGQEAALDASCGLATGVFGVWSPHEEGRA